ncbi:MAG TPA: PP2C family protein-serine/threonine phosphatase [Acidobacteriaceae bacterium]|nr:PP2C family protein-serine/threonine phosphatase [Acidobacteriaceae bacterium]
MRRFLLLSLIATLSAPAVRAQTFDAVSAGGPLTITAPWRFHTGDNPVWASPSFDDSNWALHLIEKSWADQGLPDYSGYSWLRLRVKLPATDEPLALLVYPLADAEEVYADGKLVGTIGQMRPPLTKLANETAEVLPLPAAADGRMVVVAIRAWTSAGYAPFYGWGAGRAPVLGTPADLTRIVQLIQARSAFGQADSWLISVVGVVIGLFSLGLFLFRRQATEYAWAAAFLLGTAAHALLLIWLASIPIQGGPSTYLQLSSGALVETAWLLFIWSFLGSKYDRLFYAALVVNWIRPTAPFWVLNFHASVSQAFFLGTVAHLSISVIILVKLVAMLRRGNRDAQLLLAPFLLNSAVLGLTEARSALHAAGLSAAHGLWTMYTGHGLQITWDDLSLLLSFIAIGAVLVLRFTESARQAQRLSSEMESARQIQSQLVPATLPTVPGLRFEAAYLPAAEVGGDFYQIIPQQNGSALLVIGDVSGKGLKAAMTGTLVLGALRSLAQADLSPARILLRLNDQLIAASDGGFVTCVVARIAADGSLTLANAGHLSPYRNGQEVPLEGGLPLGIATETEFPEIKLQLTPNDRLTLLSDGVVEAQAHTGELFGFDRTRTISTQSAEAIAHAALSHGQQDDITVLTLTFAPAEVIRA